VRTPVLDLVRPIAWVLAQCWFGLELRGTENIPPAGPLVVTPNHQTYADPPLVTIPIRRRVYYMAWNRLFDVPLLGWLIRRLRAFPVSVDVSDPRATREAVRLLTAGHVLMIFPEGGRSRDGAIGPFKPGAFRLAASLGVPVLPVTILGGHECWPPGRVLPRRGRMTIIYHPPVTPDPALPPREAARKLAEQVRAIVVGGATTPQRNRSCTW
jgi:1-acyl-sn-glycerol-3-phosphate acyltransferase